MSTDLFGQASFNCLSEMTDIAFLEKSIAELYEAARSRFMSVRPLGKLKIVEFPKPRRRSYKLFRPLTHRQESYRLNELWTDQLAQGTGSDAGNEETERDLDSMVRDFIENGFAEDRKHLSETRSNPFHDQDNVRKLQALLTMSETEQSVYRAIVSAISSMDLENTNDTSADCGGSCMRWELVSRLNLEGYRAFLCKSKWDQSGRLPAGEYEFIHVSPVSNSPPLTEESFIVDMDFLTQFRIARPVASYKNLLKVIPPIFVGKRERLEKILELMAGAAVASLKTNGMHVPPWRSLEYLRAKWFSGTKNSTPSCHRAVPRPLQTNRIHECHEHLQYLKGFLKERGDFSQNKNLQRQI